MCAIYNVRSRSGRPWNVKYICKWYYIKGKRFCSSWSGFSLTYLLYLTFIQEYIPYKHKHKQKHKYIYIYICIYTYISISIYFMCIYLSVYLSLYILYLFFFTTVFSVIFRWFTNVCFHIITISFFGYSNNLEHFWLYTILDLHYVYFSFSDVYFDIDVLFAFFDF